jgi:hypothetical protein
MRSKVWVWFLAGWLISLVISPAMVMGVFRPKSSG